MTTSWSSIALGALIGGGFGLILPVFLTTIAKGPEGVLRWSLGRLHSSWGRTTAGWIAVGQILGFVLWGALLLMVVFACKPLVMVWAIYARSVVWAWIVAMLLGLLLQSKRRRAS
jgi:hypothetical protein